MSGRLGGVDLSEVTTVLLVAPAAGEYPMDACVQAFDGVSGAIDRAVAVTVTGSAGEWLSLWDDASAAETTAVTCVDVDDRTRSVATRSASSDAAIERVSDPTDLEALGRRVSDVLERANEAGEAAAVAVHSLSGVVGHSDESTAFKFVYTLGEIARRVNGVVFYHLDPAAHDPETVETFRIVCDAVVEPDRGTRAQ